MKLGRILVALDFSDSSLAALDWAVRHLAPDAEVVLSHTEPGSAPPSFLRDVLPPATPRWPLLAGTPVPGCNSCRPRCRPHG